MSKLLLPVSPPVLSAPRPVRRRASLFFSRPCLARRAAFGGLLALGSVLGLGTTGSVAAAGDSPDGPVGPSAPSAPAVPAAPEPGVPSAAAPSLRAASVEVEVRALERVLGGLRRARTDLRAGRPEPVLADEAARQAHAVELRALREVLRYEGTRAKTLAALAKAVDAHDEAKASEARATLETLDGTFVAALEHIESAPKAPAPKAPTANAADPKAGAAAGEAPKPAEQSPAPKKRARAPGATGPGKEKPAGVASGGGKMSSPDDEEDALDDFLDLADDLGE